MLVDLAFIVLVWFCFRVCLITTICLNTDCFVLCVL